MAIGIVCGLAASHLASCVVDPAYIPKVQFKIEKDGSKSVILEAPEKQDEQTNLAKSQVSK